jgi:hypothetical protein
MDVEGMPSSPLALMKDDQLRPPKEALDQIMAELMCHLSRVVRMNMEWGSVAEWAQAISSTVVLALIYMQMRQVNRQMTQSEELERYRRSWEFVTFCREELREDERAVAHLSDTHDQYVNARDTPEFKELIDHFYKPRLHIFALLNQLIQHQEVDERVLYGYLEDDFIRFVELGIANLGQQSFTREVGPKLDLLLTLWGSHSRIKTLLIPEKNQQATPSS